MKLKRIDIVNAVSYGLILFWMLLVFTDSINANLNYFISVLLLGVQVFDRIKNGKLNIKKSEYLFICWLLGYAILGFISSIWALDSGYSIATARMLMYTAIGPIALLLFLNDESRIKTVLDIILLASLYMIFKIVIHLGDSIRSDVVISNATGLYFNTVCQMLAFLIIFSYLLGKKTQKKYYYIYILLAYIIILYAGSRKSLLFPIIIICFTEIYSSKNLNQKIRNIILIILMMLLVYTVVSSDQLLYSRMQNLFLALSGDVSADASAVERYYYRDLAISMFKERPLLGYGLDNFQVKLIQLHYGHIAYSHNNWTEVASNLGIVGLTAYYWFYIYVIKKNWRKFKKKVYNSVFIVATTVSFMLFEYGIVSYGIQFYKIIFVILLSMTCSTSIVKLKDK